MLRRQAFWLLCLFLLAVGVCVCQSSEEDDNDNSCMSKSGTSCCVRLQLAGQLDENICNLPCCTGAPCVNGTNGNVTLVGLVADPGVFAVFGSPVTTEGILNVTLVEQIQGTFLASPTLVDGIPSFRSIEWSDLPDDVGTLSNVTLVVPQSILDVSGSPVTGEGGTLLITLVEQNPNTVWAGPASGSLASQPAFRYLVVEDLPINGTVTYVGLLAPESLFNVVSGSPITHSGNFTLTLSDQPAHWVFAGPIGPSDGVPSFRPLDTSDLPNGTGTVTEVSLYLPAAVFGVTGSPVTSDGAFNVTFVEQEPNTVWAGPPGGNDTEPSFRRLIFGDLPAETGTVKNVSMVADETVFSVFGSPINSSGIFNLSFIQQEAHRFFAGPTGGGPGIPVFRELVAEDLPSETGTIRSVSFDAFPTSVFSVDGSPVNTTTGGFNLTLVSQPAHWVLAAPLGGSGPPNFRPLESSDFPQGTGTVTSVGLELPTNVFSVGGSPVTSNGTLVGSLISQSANLVWSGPANGSPLAPTFRSLVMQDLPAEVGTVQSVALEAPASVFEVDGSPITSSGFLNLTFVKQEANVVLAGPASGGPDDPSFRSLVFSDLPLETGTVKSVALVATPSVFSVAGSPVTTSGAFNLTLVEQPAHWVLAAPENGDGIPSFRFLEVSDLPNGTGTVTSVALSAPSSIFSIAGSPVTTSGTLNVTLVEQVANTFLSGPATGAASTPSFRSIVASDLPPTTGTVQSVGLVATPSIFSVTGTPVTTSGTFNLTFLPQSPHYVLAGPSTGGGGGDGLPFFRLLETGDLPAGTGTVTSVALVAPASLFSVSGSPVTSSGTLSFTLVSQSANTIFAGPTLGTPSTPTFRSLVLADLPPETGTLQSVSLVAAPHVFNVTGSPVTGTSGGFNVTFLQQTAHWVLAAPVGGDGVPSFRALVASDFPAGTGTVTSVALSVPAALLSVSGSPVTTSGTFAVSLVTQTANTVFAGPTTGGPSAPTFRLLVASDLPAGTGTVTSVALSVPAVLLSVTGSPVTTSGTLAVSLVTQTANTVLAGPTTGGPSTPTFRSLVVADLPVGTGTVTSVALTVPGVLLSVSGSPVTSSGTLAVSLVTQTANTVLAGPTTGGPSTPTFRSLVAADLPAGTGTVTSVTLTVPGALLSVAGSPVTSSGTLAVSLVTQTANTLLAGPTTGGPALPTFRSLVTADLPAGTGTVTSVAASVPASLLSVSGSPVTTSGTLGFSLVSQSPNTVFAGPSTGGSDVPSFRPLVTADLPAGTGTVTSVGLAMPASEWNVANSPVTSSGTLNVTKVSQAPGTVYAGPTLPGSAAAPTFRRLAANDCPGSLIFNNLITATGSNSIGNSGTTVTMVVECLGGGGGGGGAAATAATASSAGSGGQSGSYGRSTITGVTTPTTLAYTIGAGGAGGPGTTAGTTGGTTTLTINGALFISCPGGSGGTSVTASSLTSDLGTVPGGGSGSAPTVTGGSASILVAGVRGDQGLAFASTVRHNAAGGSGGSSIYGSGGRGTSASDLVAPTQPSTNGNAATVYGSGGSGAANTASSAASTGGAGSNGMIYVQIYSGS
jgi:hypothetical protein